MSCSTGNAPQQLKFHAIIRFPSLSALNFVARKKDNMIFNTFNA
jgi:hypothetical protein